MSWDGYAASCLQYDDQPACTEAWILGDDGSVWGYAASNSDTQGVQSLDGTEMARIFKVAKDGIKDDDAERGVLVQGEKYVFVQAEPGSYVFCRLKDKTDTKNIVFAAAATCMVVGKSELGMQPGNTMIQVQRVRDQLKENGY